jgi:hypothetical protein
MFENNEVENWVDYATLLLRLGWKVELKHPEVFKVSVTVSRSGPGFIMSFTLTGDTVNSTCKRIFSLLSNRLIDI